jgi:hypothetical protein
MLYVENKQQKKFALALDHAMDACRDWPQPPSYRGGESMAGKLEKWG